MRIYNKMPESMSKKIIDVRMLILLLNEINHHAS